MMPRELRVLYDHQIFGLQDVGGISHSFTAYARELRGGGFGVLPQVGCVITNNHHLRSAWDGRFLPAPRFRGAGRLVHPLNRMLARPLASRADVLHPTYYLAGDMPDGTTPVVSTVHDMVPELMPQWFAGTSPHQAKRAYCERSDLLVCVSEQTRQDLVRLFGIPRDKTRVVYHGIDLDSVQRDVEAVPGMPGQYLLYVGQRSGYKNFGTLVEAMGLLRRSELHLVCVGGGRLTAAEMAQAGEAGVAARLHQLRAGDRALRWLYRRAAGFVYPSLYEGFGMPILEALAQRCPLVLARASCFPEIAGEAAVYFDPLDPASCAEALERVLTDDPRPRAEAGLRLCRELTWRRAAESLAQIYREAREMR